MPLSVQEFSAKIKAKYPEYQNVDDVKLSKAIVEKYPEYQGKVDFNMTQAAAPKPEASTAPSIPNQRLSEEDQKAFNDQFLSQNKEAVGKIAGAALGAVAKPIETAQNVVSTGTTNYLKANQAQEGEEVATEEDWNRTAENVGEAQHRQEKIKADRTEIWKDAGVGTPRYLPDKNTISDIGTGAIKGIASTISGASELGQKGLSAVTTPIIQKFDTNYKAPEVASLPKEFTTPANPAENVGYMGEQIGEFLLPSGAISKVGQVEKGASIGAKLLGVGKKALAEGLTTGAISATQEGEINENVVDTALYSAAIPVIGETFKSVSTFLKNGKVKAARNEIAKLIKPEKGAYLFGKDPALAVAEKGIVANSWDDLIKKISNVKEEAGAKIQSAVVSADPSKFTSVTDLLNENVANFAAKNADTATQRTYIAKVQDLVNKTVPDIISGEVKVVGKVPLESLNAQGVWDLQKKVGQLTKWTNQAGENEANKQLHKLYTALGKRLDELAPGTKAAQFEYANFLGAEKAAKARAAVATRNSNALTAIGGITAGTAIAGAQGGKPEDYIRNAIFGAGLPAIIRSPLFKTRIAKFLAKESGQTPKVVTDVMLAFSKYGLSSRDTGLVEKEKQ